jgi:hypothetical protein
MGTRDRRIDAYIAKAQPFARPILEHLRAVAHAASPRIVEDVKWGMPFFVCDGRIVCHMAAFKAHAAFGLYRAAEVLGARAVNREAMGNFGRLTHVRDLPPRRVLLCYLRKAVALAAAPRPARASAATRRPAPRLAKPRGGRGVSPLGARNLRGDRGPRPAR